MEDLITSKDVDYTELTTNHLQLHSTGGGEDVTWVEGGEQPLVIVAQTVLLILFCVLGTLTNSLVLWLFNRRPALRSLSNRFVLSLVTANILISSMIAPLMLLQSILGDYLPTPCLPQLISMLSSAVIFSAIFSTFLIATDRFYAVTSPLHYSMTITRSRSQVMIILAWVLGVALALPYLVLCLLPPQFHQHLQVLYTITQLLLGYISPFCGLCWLYLRMYHAAHRNSERTRKHSISGELLTVLDGTSSLIPPQGIDFLTHYMNPFAKGMAGSSVPTPQNSTTTTTTTTTTHISLVPVVKKQRRRSSSGSSSSLLFREEGRAIKTALLVLVSFLLCWTPHFAFILLSEMEGVERQLEQLAGLNLNLRMGGGGGGNIAGTTPTTLTTNHPHHYYPHMGADWVRFFGIFGILISCLLNPFIYVFRNKMACKEVSKLLCSFFREKRRLAKHEAAVRERHQHLLRERSDSVAAAAAVVANTCCDTDPELDLDGGHRKYSPCLGKSPKRSSLKSLTPQSSVTSTTTNVNSPCHPPILSSKPPFMRSMTVPEQSQPRVKFPPNLVRQKSCVHRPPVGSGVNIELTPALSSKRGKFVRQDSICSILSNDSVLMICAEDGLMSVSESLLRSGVNGQFPLQKQHSYLRQDSNFSDASHKTNDSGVVLSMSTSAKQSAANSPSLLPHHQHHNHTHLRHTHLQTTI